MPARAAQRRAATAVPMATRAMLRLQCVVGLSRGRHLQQRRPVFVPLLDLRRSVPGPEQRKADLAVRVEVRVKSHQPVPCKTRKTQLALSKHDVQRIFKKVRRGVASGLLPVVWRLTRGGASGKEFGANMWNSKSPRPY